MTRIDEFKMRIEEERSGYQGQRWRCPKELRSEVTAVGRDLVAQGWTRARLASALGLRTATVTRWLSKDDGDSSSAHGFRRVELTPARAPGLSVVTPSGLRVEGLDLEQVKQLLRDVL